MVGSEEAKTPDCSSSEITGRSGSGDHGVGYSSFSKYEGNEDTWWGRSWEGKREGRLKGGLVNQRLKLSRSCDGVVDVVLPSLR